MPSVVPAPAWTVAILFSRVLVPCALLGLASCEEPLQSFVHDAGQGADAQSMLVGPPSDAAVAAAPDATTVAVERSALTALSPAQLPAALPDRSNAYADDPAAARLGQKMFFDPGFSGALLDGDNDGSKNALGMRGEPGRVSCAGCHVPEAGFSDNRTLGGAISLGAGWGRRRTPSLLDVGQSTVVMWDGRHDTLYNQVFGPFESGFEMNSSRLYVAQHVYGTYRAEYEAVFGPLPPLADSARFPSLSPTQTGCRHLDNAPFPPVCDGDKRGMPGDGAEYDEMAAADQHAVTQVVVNVGKAISAYERLLRCGQGRFDAWVQGDDSALSAAEQRGAALFVGKAHCVDCHSGPFFSDQGFHNVGMRAATVSVVFTATNDPGASVGVGQAMADPLNVRGEFSDGDDGRLPSRVPDAYTGAFRTPTLRCVDMRPRFMHTGQLRSLEEVVAFFNRGGDTGGYVGASELHPLGLSADEEGDLVAFLRALRGPGPGAELLARP
ncbi:MAG: hypothetical protein JWN04_4596 [Myxococcaceae bacterium]|nr:hypothetical protein [Myxococcaceae bacterium]